MDQFDFNQKTKIVFLDTEFTGEHAYTTLVSLGMVTLCGEHELYVTLNDYSDEQVTPWLKENVLSQIDEKKSISSFEAYQLVHDFLSKYAENEKVFVVTRGLLQDFLLLIELYRFACPENRYFHTLECLPNYLKHFSAIDLNTLLRTAGVDPSIDLTKFISNSEKFFSRHRAIDDAHIVREAFLKISYEPSVISLLSTLS